MLKRLSIKHGVSLAYGLFLIVTVSICCNAEMIAEGDEIAELKVRSGRVYQDVKIRAVLPNGLKIFHYTGATTLPPNELPQYAEMFSQMQSKAEAANVSKPETKEVEEPAWMPSSIEDVADCSVFVRILRAHDGNGGITSWAGTGFLCNRGKVTYIYSNYHNFDGAIEFSIETKSGEKITDFVSVETAADGHGLWKEAGWGGDIVRIRLKNYRKKALTIARNPVSAKYSLGIAIGVTGNTGGRGEITELEGVITKIEDNYMIKHNAATEPGNSGSPIVDLKTFKVIGILTWGKSLPDVLQEIWLKKPPEVRDGIKTGAGLATIRFSPTDFKKLETQKLIFDQIKKNVRLLGLMDTLLPRKKGIFLDTGKRVMGDYTVDDLLTESSDHPVVVELLKLDRYLSKRAESNIGMNNGDLMKLYVRTYRKCLLHISRIRKGVENSNSANFYVKCEINRSRMLDVSKAYEKSCTRTLIWYQKQLGVGGTPMPLAKDLRLPSFRSGLKGLGLK